MLEEVFNEVYDKFKIKFYRNIFEKFDNVSPSLNVLELFCVEVIYALNRPNMSELTKFMGISQPNTAYRVASLVKKGYVKKIQSEEDKREFYLEVTDKYSGYNDIKKNYVRMVLSRLDDKVTKEELKTFEKVIGILSNELKPMQDNDK